MKRKNLIKLAAIVLSLALVLPMILGACAAEEPTPTSPTATSPAPPPEAEVLRFKVGDWHPPRIPATRAAFWVIREWERRSGGRVEFEYYFSSTLAGGKELLSALRTGVADISPWVPGYNLGAGPLADVGWVPGVVGTTYSGILAFNRLMEEVPEVEQEFTNNNVVYIGGTGNPECNIVSTKPIHSLDDLQGLKIAATGHQQKLLSEFGVPPVSLVSTEVYEAMQRGTVDGNTNNPEWARVYSFHEPGEYWYNIPVGGFIFYTLMNKDAYDGLPADLRGTLDSLRELQAEANYQIYDIGWDLKSREIMYESLEVVNPTQAEIDEFKNVAQETVWADWVNQIEEKGLPGEKVFDRWLYWNEYYSEQEHPRYIGWTEDNERQL